MRGWTQLPIVLGPYFEKVSTLGLYPTPKIRHKTYVKHKPNTTLFLLSQSSHIPVGKRMLTVLVTGAYILHDDTGI
jgi:hypothetical protein